VIETQSNFSIVNYEDSNYKGMIHVLLLFTLKLINLLLFFLPSCSFSLSIAHSLSLSPSLHLSIYFPLIYISFYLFLSLSHTLSSAFKYLQLFVIVIYLGLHSISRIVSLVVIIYLPRHLVSESSVLSYCIYSVLQLKLILP
jgi:hypothetical protein